MAEARQTSKRVARQDDAIVVVLPPIKAPAWLQGFVNFVREQGVVGLAVGLVLGVASKGVVDSLVANIFNPIIGVLTGGESLATKAWCMKHTAEGACQAGTKLGYGQVMSDLLSFVIVAAVVYFVVKGLKLDKLDKKKA